MVALPIRVNGSMDRAGELRPVREQSNATGKFPLAALRSGDTFELQLRNLHVRGRRLSLTGAKYERHIETIVAEPLSHVQGVHLEVVRDVLVDVEDIPAPVHRHRLFKPGTLLSVLGSTDGGINFGQHLGEVHQTETLVVDSSAEPEPTSLRIAYVGPQILAAQVEGVYVLGGL
jgi:hypothetical protein